MAKFINQSYKVLHIPDPIELEVCKFLETIGRICYKSEDKITDESAFKFIDALRKRKHWAILEHYVFVAHIYDTLRNAINSIVRTALDCDLTKVVDKSRYIMRSHDYISFSPTVWNYFMEAVNDVYNIFNRQSFEILAQFTYKLHSSYPHLFIFNTADQAYQQYKYDIKTCWSQYSDMSVGYKLLSKSEIRNLPIADRLIHDTVTVKFITDRGITHELVRHRPFSFAQESTRYCNYGKDGVTYIIPPQFSEQNKESIQLDPTGANVLIDPIQSRDVEDWVKHMLDNDKLYNKLVNEDHWTPQQARSILPNCVKTEIMMTGRLIHWVHFFRMRADKAAHPQMQDLAYPLLKEFELYDKDIFKNCNVLDKELPYPDSVKTSAVEEAEQSTTEDVCIPVSPVEVNRTCPVCKHGFMRICDGEVKMSNPPLYPHECSNCHHKMDLPTQYPFIQYTYTNQVKY